MPTWLSYILGAVIAALVAILLAPLIPDPGDRIVAIVAWIVCVLLAVLGLVALIRSPRV
jgi:multisubunit Na+/H+ antiporter MnhE subunit